MSKKFDGLLFATIVALGAISILTIFAANRSLGLNQFIFWILGLGIFFFFSNFYYPNWYKIALPFYFVTTITLVVVFILGDPVRGSVRWFDLGIFRFQPSEIAKVGSILLLSSFYLKRSAQKINNLIISFLIVIPTFILIFIEPDIGSAVAIIAIWLGISFAAGLKIEHLLAVTLSFALLSVIAYELLAPFQKERIATFLAPQRDPLGAGYNIIQSQIAVGSGQIFGRGLGRGPQSQLNFLPESESDFIFASIAEQLGLVGAFLVIFLSTTLIIRLLIITKEGERFGQLIIIGIISLLIYQFTVNVGMNIGIVPVTGITLPLTSYGGSSLVSTLLLLAIAFSIKRQQY